MYNVLLIDDDRDTLDLLDSFFPKDRFHTFLEGNLSSAKKTLERIQPDLVVSDVVLAGETGLDFVQHIRQSKLNPIIFLITGYDNIKGEDAYNEDVHLFIRKPILAPSELVSAALRFLRSKPSKTSPVSLSRREREIINLIANGLTTPEIGSELKISPRTVAKHRENMLRRNGAKNIIDLVMKSGLKETI